MCYSHFAGFFSCPNHGQQGQGPFYGQDFFESNRTQSATKGKLDST